jgi:sporulation protein YlmC with PRC-barrel domain
MKDYERNLQRFSDMEDVEVAEDDPDVRGWDVVTRDGQDIGEVKDLLVDTDSMKVRCLEIELEGSHFKWNDNRRVAIPIESVQLDEEHDDVVVNGLGLDEIGRLDEYRPARGSLRDVYPRGSRPGTEEER